MANSSPTVTNNNVLKVIRGENIRQETFRCIPVEKSLPKFKMSRLFHVNYWDRFLQPF